MDEAEDADASPVLDIALVLVSMDNLLRTEPLDKLQIACVAIRSVGLGHAVDGETRGKGGMGPSNCLSQWRVVRDEKINGVPRRDSADIELRVEGFLGKPLHHRRPKRAARRGPLTPDHTIRTKRLPAVIADNPEVEIAGYAGEYQRYFDRHAKSEHRRLDPAPRWAVWQDRGLLSFGASRQEASQILDIAAHTAQSILDAEALGGWHPLSAAELFAIEYWELEQRKLKSSAARPQLQGKIALVTGAAAGIGRLCAEELLRQGACVVGIDISAELDELKHPSFLGLRCDLGVEAELKAAVERCVAEFGGLDIVICNAGIFIAGDYVEKLENIVPRMNMELLKANVLDGKTLDCRVLKSLLSMCYDQIVTGDRTVGSRSISLVAAYWSITQRAAPIGRQVIKRSAGGDAEGRRAEFRQVFAAAVPTMMTLWQGSLRQRHGQRLWIASRSSDKLPL
ncbi:MAG: hypothetical protein RL095_429 [Verrucomicrobiota bacterium]